MTNIKQFHDKLMASVERMDKIKQFTDQELASELLHHVWADLYSYSYAADLVEEAIERLGGIGESED